MSKNKNLNDAARAKKDEFYTQLSDIDNEVQHYTKHFPGKKILCNCDDPFESQFFYHFAVKFYEYKLQKLTATSYKTSPIMGDLFNPVEDKKVAYKVEINEIKILPNSNRDGVAVEDVKALMNELKAALGDKDSVTVGKNTLSILHYDGNFRAGDFRSKECLAALDDSDLVITNPPFSLFREFVKLLMEKNKLFLIIGNINCLTYKEIFPLIMQNKVWLGYGMGRAISGFYVPDYYELYGTEARINKKGKRVVSTNQCLWLTNLNHDKRHKPIYLVERYERTPEKFPRYDNYDAIEVSKTLDIPEDYFGVMGVPITFLDKYCPEQFEIIGMAKRGAGDPALKTKVYTPADYSNYSDLNAGPVLITNGVPKNTYPRILIRRRQNP